MNATQSDDVEQDITVDMPPVSEFKIKVRIVKIEKGEPCI